MELFKTWKKYMVLYGLKSQIGTVYRNSDRTTSFYDIVLDFESSQKSLPHEVFDGSNDSANAIWLPLEQMTEENASPLVLKVKAELRGFPELELTRYRNWKVKKGNYGTI